MVCIAIHVYWSNEKVKYYIAVSPSKDKLVYNSTFKSKFKMFYYDIKHKILIPVHIKHNIHFSILSALRFMPYAQFHSLVSRQCASQVRLRKCAGWSGATLHALGMWQMPHLAAKGFKNVPNSTIFHKLKIKKQYW